MRAGSRNLTLFPTSGLQENAEQKSKMMRTKRKGAENGMKGELHLFRARPDVNQEIGGYEEKHEMRGIYSRVPENVEKKKGWFDNMCISV